MSRMTPKAAQQMMQTHGHTYIGMAPKPGFPGAAAPPRPIRDIGTGAPPFNPNNPRATTSNPTPPVIDNKPVPDFVVGATPPPPRGGKGFPKPVLVNPSRPKPIVTPKKQAMGFGGGLKKGGKVSSASKRADGIAKKGKTKGKMV